MTESKASSQDLKIMGEARAAAVVSSAEEALQSKYTPETDKPGIQRVIDAFKKLLPNPGK